MSDAHLREHLANLLQGGGAHLTFDDAVADLPEPLRGQRPQGLPYSPWEQLEHMRIAQWDILAFSQAPGHRSPDWPTGYWPGSPAPPDAAAWNRAIRAFRRDNQAMRKLILNPERDLFEPLPWGRGETLLREAMLMADHNSYHLGEFIVLRRLLGNWIAC